MYLGKWMQQERETILLFFIGWIVSSHIPVVALLNIVRPYMKLKKIINPSPVLSFELLSLLLKTLKQFKNIFLNLDYFSLLFFIKALLIFNEKKRKKWKICVYLSSFRSTLDINPPSLLHYYLSDWEGLLKGKEISHAGAQNHIHRFLYRTFK